MYLSKGIFGTMFVTSSQLMRDALPNNPAKSSFIQNLSPCANCEALLVRILGRQLPSLPSIPPPILCHKQGRSQGMQRVQMHPRGSVPPPPHRVSPTRLCGVTKVNFLGIHTRLAAAKCALLKC